MCWNQSYQCLEHLMFQGPYPFFIVRRAPPPKREAHGYDGSFFLPPGGRHRPEREDGEGEVLPGGMDPGGFPASPCAKIQEALILRGAQLP